jgi:cell division protein FtsZ
MGIGRATGENRAVEAARAAIESPMLDITIDGAKGIVFNITCGPDLRMYEVDAAARTITEHADPNAKVIFGAVIDQDQVEEGEIKITVVATGFDKPQAIVRPRSASGFATPQQHAPVSPAPLEPRMQPMRSSYSMQQPQQPQAQPPIAAPKPRLFAQQPQQPEEEDLEVPTFIRRKMRERKESLDRDQLE